MSDDRLAPCPAKPNCVSTLAPAEDTTHHAEPIPHRGNLAEAMGAVLASLALLPRTEIVERDVDYVHAVVTSRLLRFKDDVEFVVGVDHIDFRSASRVGTSDLGVNRKRMTALSDDIRRRLEEA